VTPTAPEWRVRWLEFLNQLQSRMDAGHAQYGDGSFTRPPAELLYELEQEALDIAGWGYVLWCRLRNLRAKVDTNIP